MDSKELIRTYCIQKSQESALNKSNKKLSEDIKKSLIENNQTDAEADEYSVHLEKRVTESIDEEKMMTVLEDFWHREHGEEDCPFIGSRTIYFVDSDALEKYMYQNDLPEDVILALDGCRIKEETIALKYKINKEKKSDKEND
jgi:hypothetical protein